MPATLADTKLADAKLVITGAAGLVGQNLILRLREMGARSIVAIDKHAANAASLAQFCPDVTVIAADLASDDGWQSALEGADAILMLHAQIGGLYYSEFEANNITASARVLSAAKQAGVPYLVHISSSVVNSAAVDFYTESKKAQEALVEQSGLRHVTLRPTLMFGWFDRKHLGWLARFMQRVPLFPIPGSGRYLRQPLFVRDFCDIIIACLERRMEGAYNITGLERIDYIDLIALVKKVTHARAILLRIPYGLFYLLLRLYALADRNPPFTTQQLAALVTPDVFEIIDWPGIFGVRATPLTEALEITLTDQKWSNVALEF